MAESERARVTETGRAHACHFPPFFSLALSPIPTIMSTPPVDAAALQRHLDHDNHETRRQLKELMKDPLFVP